MKWIFLSVEGKGLIIIYDPSTLVFNHSTGNVVSKAGFTTCDLLPSASFRHSKRPGLIYLMDGCDTYVEDPFGFSAMYLFGYVFNLGASFQEHGALFVFASSTFDVFML